jgi:hypothetical protein
VWREVVECVESYIFRKIQLQVTFGLLHLGKSGSFRHSAGKMAQGQDKWNRVFAKVHTYTKAKLKTSQKRSMVFEKIVQQHLFRQLHLNLVKSTERTQVKS